jgi:hypothetical protein
VNNLLPTAEERRTLEVSQMALMLGRVKRHIGQRARAELNRPDFSGVILQDMADTYLRLCDAEDQFRHDHGMKLEPSYPDWVKVYARELQRDTDHG